MRVVPRTLLLCGMMAACLTACGDDDSDNIDGGGGVDADGTAIDASSGSCDLGNVRCVDDIILDLSLHDDKISSGTVLNSMAGADHKAVVDATAGGFGESDNNPFIYLKFEESGLTKLDIDDETALESQEWHIAARRFVIRLNGGVSGPGCVGALGINGSSFEELDAIPVGASFQPDSFYTASCDIMSDSSGLEGSPAVALSGWWGYGACVTTTSKPFLIELGDGGPVVKFVADAYYETGQESCNSSGAPGTTSGMLTWRWSYLD
jgi:hypothetical protein